MSRFAIKGPRTYRKEFPGRHVVAVLFVEPGDNAMLIEMAVDQDLFQKIAKLCVDEMDKKATKQAEEKKG